MAQPIPCDFCGVEPAALMVGNLDNGQQLAVGAQCAPVALGQLAAQYGSAPEAPAPSEPAAPVPAAEDDGAGGQPAPRPQSPQDDAGAPAGSDSQSATDETGVSAQHAS